MSNLENIILRTVERSLAGRYHERHGLVTAYDPDNYLAKVALMPEGTETGWLEIETAHVGQGWGVAIGLTPGDGQTTGDQVIVRFQEGDVESGKIVQRVHSEQDKPPRAEAGEIVIQHSSGTTIKYDKNGNLTHTGPSGKNNSSVIDNVGNVIHTSPTMVKHNTPKHIVTGVIHIAAGGTTV